MVEVLAAIVVLAVGVLAGLQVLSSGSGAEQTSERLSAGVAVGERVLEDLRAVPYDELALHAAATAVPTGTEDPTDRLTTVGGTPALRTLAGPTEELVALAPSARYADAEVVTEGRRRYAVHRFVSWRDEECPVVDLGALEDALGDLRGLLTSLTATLTTLVGPGGTLTATLTTSQGLLGGGLLGSLGLSALLSSVTQLTAVLNPLLSTLGPLLAPLDGLLDAVDAVLDPVTGRLTDTLDLCDIPSGTVPSLADVSVVVATLQALGPVLTTVSSTTTHVGAIVTNLASLNLFGLLGAVVQAPVILVDVAKLVTARSTITTLLGGLTDTLGHPTQLTTLATDLTSSLTKLAGLLAAPDTTHNSKRLTVAVQLLDAGDGWGPSRPIWLSTVVTDPEDGLL
jgi:Tfp pilus assembly protein PilV